MLRLKQDAYAKKSNGTFMPDFIAKNVQDIDFKLLREYGIKYCLIDLDDTVVERSSYIVSNEVKNALEGSGLDIYIATNRPKSRDLKNLRIDLGAKGVVHPHFIFGKPTKRYFIDGVRDMSLDARSTIMIGDRLIQDIYGANRAGLYSLLVHKLGKPVGRLDALISKLEAWWIFNISKSYITK